MLNAVVIHTDGTIQIVGTVEMAVIVKTVKAALPQLSQMALESLTAQINELQGAVSEQSAAEEEGA